jgi:cobalt-precorrin-5B (C1)-methyltransferase
MTEPGELREPDLPRTARVRQTGLRTGWTTGACAAAAAKAAAVALETGQLQDSVEIVLPAGRRVVFAVTSCRLLPGPARPGGASGGGRAEGGRAEAVVVKDAGDDPDVTHGAHLTALVSWRAEAGLDLDGGEGVGVVTKPGLGLEVGSPAINPVPRQMITQAVGEVIDLAERGARVVISVPGGEKMARKTTNARLGILGGISILGTTGIVRPFSTASWRASVEQAVAVAAAQGVPAIVLCTGGRTERAAMALLPGLPDVSFVEVGDFTGAALRRVMEHGVPRVVFVGMAGKLVKLAAGVLMTHYTRSRVSTGLLAEITRAAGGGDALAAEVAGANTARHAAELWEAAGLLEAAGTELCRRVAGVLARFCAEIAGASGAGRADEATGAAGADEADGADGAAKSGTAEASGADPAGDAEVTDGGAEVTDGGDEGAGVAGMEAGAGAGVAGAGAEGAGSGERRRAAVLPAVEVMMVDFSGRKLVAAWPGRS